MTESPKDPPTQLTDPTEWVDRHGDVLFRYALTRVGDRHVAEHLVQETFVAALRSGEYAGKAGEQTWFVGILKHKIVDFVRRRTRERADESSSLGGKQEELFDAAGWWRVQPGKWPADRDDALANYEFWEAFRHCLDGLPQRLRTVFSLREMDDQSTEELCTALRISPGNLAVLLYRARMGLRRCLEIHWFCTAKDEA